MYFPGLAFEIFTSRNMKNMLCNVTPCIKRQTAEIWRDLLPIYPEDRGSSSSNMMITFIFL